MCVWVLHRVTPGIINGKLKCPLNVDAKIVVVWTLSHFCTLRATSIFFVCLFCLVYEIYTRTLEKMHNTRSLSLFQVHAFRFSAVLFHCFCLFLRVCYIVHNLMYVFVFVYATHKKTELVWKIQPRFVFTLEHSVSGSKFWISDQQFEKKVINNYFASQLCWFVFCFACCCCCL